MTPCKRVEIIIDEPLLRRVLAVLDDVGAPGHTVYRNLTGSGNRGTRRGDELTGVFNNCCVVVACEERMAMELAEALRPVLKRSGGMCLISDALWLRH